jgi:hypothetical protein
MNQYPPKKDDSKSTGSYQHSRKIDDTYILDGNSGVYEPKSYYKEKKSRDLDKNRHWYSESWTNFKKHWVSIAINALTLFVVARYTHYAYGQLEQMRIATEATREAAGAARDNAAYLLKQQRPYIYVNIPDSIAIKPGKQITISPPIRYVNHGGAPGLAQSVCYIDYIEDSDELISVRNRQNVKVNSVTNFIPKYDSHESVPKLGSCKQPVADKNGRTIAVYGRIDNTDLSADHNRYCTLFCFYRLPDGSISVCRDPQTNAMK